MVLSPNGELLYVACAFGDTSIWIIDTLRNRVIHHFAVPGTPLHIAINPTAPRLYVTDNSVAVNTPIRIYNTQDYTLIDTITGFTTVAGITLNANGFPLVCGGYRRIRTGGDQHHQPSTPVLDSSARAD